MPGKKLPSKKAGAKRVVKKPTARKSPPKKSASSPIKTKTRKKVPTKKVAAKKTKGATRKASAGGRSLPEGWEVNEHGFRVGSDLAHIVDAMVEGGADRREVVANARASINSLTSSGSEKNISSAITTLLPKLEERGYVVESFWRLVPPSKPSKVKKS